MWSSMWREAARRGAPIPSVLGKVVIRCRNEVLVSRTPSQTIARPIAKHRFLHWGFEVELDRADYDGV